MTAEILAGKVVTFLRQNYLFDDTRSIDPAASLLATGVLDSTGILELISFLEKEFGVQFLDEELTAENFDSLDRIVAILLKKTRKGA